MCKIFQYFGMGVVESTTLPYDYDPDTYVNITDETIKAHKALIDRIEKEENDRLNIIENKTSQLVAQTGMIFSLLSLFIPVLIDKISEINILFRILSLFILCTAFLFYILTILNAIKNYNVWNFKYIRPHPNTVIKYQHSSLTDFTTIEIKDSLFGINRNVKTNNRKADNLMYANRSFKIANITTAILGILLCVALLFYNKKSESIVIDKNVTINNLDSNINALTKILKEHKKTDTIIVQLKSTNQMLQPASPSVNHTRF